MGLLNKLKNALFEVEEVEVPIKEEKVKIEPPKEEKVEKQPEKKKNIYDDTYSGEIFSDRNIFKAEKTFDFPMFDDKEFESMKEMTEKEEPEPPKSMGVNLFDYDRPIPKKEKPPVKQEAIKGRAYEIKTKDLDSKKFHPSPVISPVYGVLDKNYKKEDIIVVDKKDNKKIDVDDVRKKAFGTLEDDIERSMMEHRKEEKEVSKGKSIDELLEETAFDSIKVPQKEKEEKRNFVEETPYVEEEEELEVFKEEPKTFEEQVEEDETLETDVFKLIDSMYEKKEEE